MTYEYTHQEAIQSLKDAGVRPDDDLDWIISPEIHESAALSHLIVAKSLRKTKAEREAEDAQVREFMAALPGASYTDADHELCRNLYRAAREFFNRDETADNDPGPRVLNYGDPEPDRDTKWHSERCGFMQYVGGGWKGSEYPFPRPWDWYSKLSFPMTEAIG